MTQLLITKSNSQEKESFCERSCSGDSFLFVDTSSSEKCTKNRTFHQQGSLKQEEQEAEDEEVKVAVQKLKYSILRKDDSTANNSNETISKGETDDSTVPSKDTTQSDSSIDTDSKSASSCSDSSLSSYDSDSSSDGSKFSENETNTDTRKVNPGIMDFDQQYSIQPLIILLLHCIGHTAYDECILYIVKSIFEKSSINEHTLYFLLLTFGVALLRCTGGLYSFLTPQQNRRVMSGFKERMNLFSRQKRRRSSKKTNQQRNHEFKYTLVKMDDNCQKYFKRHKFKRHFVEMMAYYMCYTAICHLNTQFVLPMISDMTQEIVEGLPSVKNFNGVESSMSLIGQRLALNKDIELPISTATYQNRHHRMTQQQQQQGLFIKNVNSTTATLTYDSFCSQQELISSTNRMMMNNSNNLIFQHGMMINEEEQDVGDKQYLQKMKSLYKKDELYLRNQLSVTEYDEFMGDEDHVFFRTRSFLIYYSILLMASTLVLEKVFRVSLWWVV